MMLKRLLLVTGIAFTVYCNQAQDLAAYVNPFIGTANSGNTIPGAVMPWGMLSLSPFNSYDTVTHRSGASPYYYGYKYIFGFTHLNMSGLGCPDMGTFCLMPITGELDLQQLYRSEYSQEVASPGYYSVNLDRYQVKAEMSTTIRSGISCYTFPKGQSHILLNLAVGLTAKKGGRLKLLSDTEIEGSKLVGDICGIRTSQTVYFAARLSKKPRKAGLWINNTPSGDKKADEEGDGIGAYFSFDTEEGEKIYVQTAVSYVSMENARLNLQAEQTGIDLPKIRQAARQAWNKALSVIELEGGTRDDRVKFYTAFYHTLWHPNLANDVNGDYRVFEKQEKANAGKGNRYTVFSLWDTYRCLHPFLSLVYPKKQSGMVKSLLGMAKESGWLPRWEYAGIESGAMTGDPCLPVITDTWLRGIHDFDIRKAYEAMRHNAVTPEKDNYMRPGMDNWLKLGYIPEDAPNVLHPFGGPGSGTQYTDMRAQRVVWGAVSTPLEYCIADWNLATLARTLGKEKDYQEFYKRSMSYKNNFDTTVGFMRSKYKDGRWSAPFDPAERKNNAFTEGASWNYTFMVPHDIPGLISLMGGEKNFTAKLDRCFDGHYFDITNEPDLAYPYLYNYVKGSEWKTQQRVRDIVNNSFSNGPGGLPDNDDCGTMSAWLMFAMMGFYPACPGDMDYQITSPVFDKVIIHLDPLYYRGKTFTIEAKKLKENSIYINSVSWNGKSRTGFVINHSEITSGGRLFFLLGNR